MELRDEIKRRWDKAAPWFTREATSDPNRTDALFPKLQAILREKLGGLDGRLILDAGCGEGRLSRELASHGARVVGVDFSALVDRATSASVDNLRFIRADLADLRKHPAFKREQQFDAVLCNLVLQGAVPLQVILQELARVLKPACPLLVVVHDSDAVTPGSPWFEEWKPQPRISDPDGGETFLVRAAPDAQPVYYFHRRLDIYRKALAGANLSLAGEEPIPAAEKFVESRPRLRRQQNRSLFRLFVAQPSADVIAPGWEESDIALLPPLSGVGGRVLSLIGSKQPAAQILIRSFRRWEPVIEEGEQGGDLFVILRGNAMPYSSPTRFREIRALSTKGTKKLDTLLKEHGELVRYILCPGQLVGEFEVLSPRKSIATVVAGVGFELLHTRSNPAATVAQVARIPATAIESLSTEREFRRQFQALVYSSFDRKLETLVHLVSLAQRGTISQLVYVIWMCFMGLLPVSAYRVAGASAASDSASSGTELIFPRAADVEAITEISIHNQFLDLMLGRDPANSLKALATDKVPYLRGLFDVTDSRPSQILFRRISIQDRGVLDKAWALLHGELARLN